MNKYTLGIGHDLWISSAAISSGGEILAATPEERLNRVKNYRGFPKRAVDFCLSSVGATLDEIDRVVIGWNPLRHMTAHHGRYVNETRWRPEYLYNIPSHLSSMGGVSPDNGLAIQIERKKIEFIDHHLAHAVGVVETSGFDECFYYILDGVGEVESSYFGYYKNGKYVKLGSVRYPHSIGLVYSAVTQYLGYRPHSDEWKVMALSAYSTRETNKFYKTLLQLIEARDDGQYRIDLNYFCYQHPEENSGCYTTFEFDNLLGLKRSPTKVDLSNGDYIDLAAAVQFVFEDKVFDLLNGLRKRYHFKKLCLAGGCFMNSVFNGKLTEIVGAENVHIGPSPDDSGIAIGAALWTNNGDVGGISGKTIKSHRGNSCYWGRSFSDDQIKNTLDSAKIKYKQFQSDAERFTTTARIIADGYIVGWFQGRSEFGQRALGNRSILADPRRIDVKDRINAAVKFRESYRPFAPAILKEYTTAYFDVQETFESYFMEKVAQVRYERRSEVPGVVHEDGSGRLQTVSAESNPEFHQLISSFFDISGVPIVLNTSFNLNGEPNVDSPTDAIRTFFTCGLDVLVMGNYIVEK